MVDRYVVNARIAKIREYVALLRRIRGMADERRFVSEPLIYGNAERFLQLAIQAVLDHRFAEVPQPISPEARQAIVRQVVERRVRTAMLLVEAEAAGYGERPEVRLRQAAVEERVLAEDDRRTVAPSRET